MVEKVVELLNKYGIEVDEVLLGEVIREVKEKTVFVGRPFVYAIFITYTHRKGINYSIKEVNKMLGSNVYGIIKELRRRGIIGRIVKKYDVEKDVEEVYRRLREKYDFSDRVLYCIAEMLVKNSRLKDVCIKYNATEPAVRRAFKLITGKLWRNYKKEVVKNA